jgi:hypothetical protein
MSLVFAGIASWSIHHAAVDEITVAVARHSILDSASMRTSWWRFSQPPTDFRKAILRWHPELIYGQYLAARVPDRILDSRL